MREVSILYILYYRSQMKSFPFLFLSPWLEIATSVDVPYGEVVFDSLINVLLGYDPVGWGVPYGGVFSTDTAKGVMELSAQVIPLRQ